MIFLDRACVSSMKMLIAAIAAACCSACQTIPPSFVSRYSPDPAVQERLSRVEGVVLAVGNFDTDADTYTDIPCRGQHIRFSRAGTLAEYIGSAMEAELSMAEMYDRLAPVVLSGTIKEVELKFDGRIASGAIGATWIVDVRFRSSNGQSLRVKSGHAYRNDFEVISCPEAARALMPAVQKLIRTAVTHPQFVSLTQKDTRVTGSLSE